MEFIAAGEIIGEAHQIRSVSLRQSPQLPDGEYAFVDMHCSDPACDCRKTMIQVLHGGKLVSIINYGWESPAFYKKWMGNDPTGTPMPRMDGASIDISSPDLVRRDGVLALFNRLLNDEWRAKIQWHYKQVKSAKAKSAR